MKKIKNLIRNYKSILASVMALILFLSAFGLMFFENSIKAYAAPKFTDPTDFYAMYGEHVFYTGDYIQFCTKDKIGSNYSDRFRTLGFKVRFEATVKNSYGGYSNQWFYVNFRNDHGTLIGTQGRKSERPGDGYEYNLYSINYSLLANAFTTKYPNAKNATGQTLSQLMNDVVDVYIDSYITIVDPDSNGSLQGTPKGSLTINDTTGEPSNMNNIYISESTMEAAWKAETGANKDFSQHYNIKVPVRTIPGSSVYYSIDVDGKLDGTAKETTANFLTFDVYLESKQVANDVTEYKATVLKNVTYEVKDIKAKSGYTYQSGSSSNLSKSSVTSNFTTVLAATTNITYYTVSFNANGGTTPSYTSKSYAKGSAYGSFPTTSKSHSIFNGWYTAASGGSKMGTSNTVTSNHTLYAQWSKDSHTMSISYDSGISSVSGAGTYTCGSSINVGATPKAHYHLAYVQDLDNGNIYNNVSTMLNGWSMTSNRHIKIFSALDKHTMYISYDNGVDPNSITGAGAYDYGTKINIGAKPKAGYHLVSILDQDSGKVWDSSNSTSGNMFLDWNMLFDRHLYINSAPNNYTVTYYAGYDNNGGLLTDNNAKLSNTTRTVTYTKGSYNVINGFYPERVGYIFGGWYTGKNGTGTQVYGADGRWINGTGYWSNNVWCYAGNATLYAKWIPITYDIYYHSIGHTGGGMNTYTRFTYDLKQKLDKITYAKTGYTAMGWSTSPDSDVIAYTPEQEVLNLTTVNGGRIDLYVVWKDITAPAVTITATPNNWTNTNVTITASANDLGSGIKNNTLVITNGAGVEVARGTDSVTYIDTSEGKETYKAVVYDNSGNVNQATCVSYIDFTAPTITNVQNVYGWTNQDVTVNANIGDTGGSELQNYVIKDANNTTIQSGTFSGNSGNVTITFTDEQNATYVLTVADNAGNKHKVAFTVKIDKVNPTITIKATPNSWTNGSVTITATASDNLSGVKTNSLIIYNEAGQTVSIGTSSASFVDTSAGKEKYTAVVYDNTGNRSEAYVYSYIDYTPPVISNLKELYTWENKDITVTANITDAGGSGLKNYILKDMNGNIIKSGAISTNADIVTYTFTEEQDKEYTLTVWDNAGNSSYFKFKIEIDKTTPGIIWPDPIPIPPDGPTPDPEVDPPFTLEDALDN